MATDSATRTHGTFDQKAKTEHIETIATKKAGLHDMDTVALVVTEPRVDFKLQPIMLDEIREDEVHVEMKFSGICASLSARFLHKSKAKGLKVTLISFLSKNFSPWSSSLLSLVTKVQSLNETLVQKSGTNHSKLETQSPSNQAPFTNMKGVDSIWHRATIKEMLVPVSLVIYMNSKKLWFSLTVKLQWNSYLIDFMSECWQLSENKLVGREGALLHDVALNSQVCRHLTSAIATEEHFKMHNSSMQLSYSFISDQISVQPFLLVFWYSERKINVRDLHMYINMVRANLSSK